MHTGTRSTGLPFSLKKQPQMPPLPLFEGVGYGYTGRIRETSNKNRQAVMRGQQGAPLLAQVEKDKELRCSVCGCNKYTKAGNTAGGRWLFACSNGHRWSHGTTLEPFPWREDDPWNPKYSGVLERWKP